MFPAWLRSVVLLALVLVTTALAVALLVVVNLHRHTVAQPTPTTPTPPTTHPTASIRTDTDADGAPVAPGEVRWHASFAGAQVAAQRSGKPVLLFHMLGHLDRQFC